MDIKLTYEDVVARLEVRIKKKRKEIRNLKAKLKAVKIEKGRADYQRIMDYRIEHNIPDDAIIDIHEK